MKDIIGYEGKYSITASGKVYSHQKKDFLIAHPNCQVQYLQVGLWKHNIGYHEYVHRLVATHFIANPLGLAEVNYKDGNKHNNVVSNLEWVNRQGNAQHAVQTGLRTYTNRLTTEEFTDCLYAVLQGETYTSLSARVPYKVPFLSTKLRKLAKELNLELQLNDALRNRRTERNRQVLHEVNTKRATTIPQGSRVK